MVALREELRNLLTEDSLASIKGANSFQNGHLEPKPLEQEAKVEENNVQITSPEKEDIAFAEELEKIKSSFKQNLQKNSDNIEMLVSKMNKIIKNLNAIEKKVSSIENNKKKEPVQEEKQQNLESKKEEPKKEKKKTHPRSMDQLPPELSIDKVFNCNGKKFN